MEGTVCALVFNLLFLSLIAAPSSAETIAAKVSEDVAAAPLLRRDSRHVRRWISPTAAAKSSTDVMREASVSPSGHVDLHNEQADTDDWRKWWQWDLTDAVRSNVASVLQMETGAAGQINGKVSHSGGHQSPAGLPWAPGAKPSWLVRTDGLVIDARSPVQKASGGGKLLVSVVSMDHSNTWEVEKAKRPKWLRVMLATNRAHAKKYGHAMVLRWQPSQPELTTWQNKTCTSEKRDHVECIKRNERENINWEKHLMLSDYLNSSQNFSHVMMLDADAMFMRPDLDSMTRMAAILDKEKKDLFTASEDWLKYGENRLNGGVLLAKNTQWTRDLFQDLFECHRAMRLYHTRTLGDSAIQCSSNEMVALNDWKDRDETKRKLYLASGRYWNRGGEVLYSQNPTFLDKQMYELGLKDPEMEIIHFMGGAKGGAAEAICKQGVSLTMEDPDGYGCGI